jgi:hypothetical protein
MGRGWRVLYTEYMATAVRQRKVGDKEVQARAGMARFIDHVVDVIQSPDAKKVRLQDSAKVTPRARNRAKARRSS